MALSKEVRCDRYEIVGRFKHIQCRTATIVKEDGVELSRAFNRRTFSIGDDLSDESDELKALSSSLWTPAVSASWSEHQTSASLGP